MRARHCETCGDAFGSRDHVTLCESCDAATLRAAGAAEERARIVAMVRKDADEWDAVNGISTFRVGGALRSLADRIERGE